MTSLLSSLSAEIAAAVAAAAPGIVQVHGRRRPVAGLVIADDLVLAPNAPLDDDTVAVRAADGRTFEGQVLARLLPAGLAVLRVTGLGVAPLATAPEPSPGHLAVAVGRTWSGGVLASLCSVAVVGGPLRTSRASSLERVLRIDQPPHGALVGGALIDGAGRVLGVITAASIRGTTVVIPAPLAWTMATTAAAQGGTKQGYLGITSQAVPLPSRQRAGHDQRHALLVTGVADDGPAAAAGLLVGDLLVSIGGDAVQEPEQLLAWLRGNRVGQEAAVGLVRGTDAHTVTVRIGERPVRS
jgi:S1-C subfamily serine protease